jgi:hypothetical protein
MKCLTQGLAFELDILITATAAVLIWLVTNKFMTSQAMILNLLAMMVI